MAYIIRPDGSQRTVVPKGDKLTLEEMQHFVGGYIELVNLPNGGGMFVNEDGRTMGLPPNNRATLLGAGSGMIAPNDPVLGTVLVLGTSEMEAFCTGEDED